MSKKSRRIGWVIPLCKLQRGITQPILRLFFDISVFTCCLFLSPTQGGLRCVGQFDDLRVRALPGRLADPRRALLLPQLGRPRPHARWGPLQGARSGPAGSTPKVWLQKKKSNFDTFSTDPRVLWIHCDKSLILKLLLFNNKATISDIFCNLQPVFIGASFEQHTR